MGREIKCEHIQALDKFLVDNKLHVIGDSENAGEVTVYCYKCSKKGKQYYVPIGPHDDEA